MTNPLGKANLYVVGSITIGSVEQMIMKDLAQRSTKSQIVNE